MMKLAAVAGLLSLLAHHADAADGVPPDWCTEDPRLNAPVSVSEPRVFLAEFLEQIGAQAAVKLATGERDGSADAQVCAFAASARLADLMDGLWSLLSYQTGTWAWRREGSAGAYVYRLERPQAARTLPSRLAALSQTMFEEDVRTLLRAAQSPPEERRGIVEAAAKRRGDEDVSAACPVLDRTWQGLQMVGDVLTEEQVAHVLRNIDPKAPLRIPLDALAPKWRAFVMEQHAEVVRAGPLPRAPEPPTWLEIETVRKGNGAPWLSLYVENLGGYGYAGGAPVERVLTRRIVAAWPVPGDALEGARDAERVGKPPPGEADPALPSWASPTARRLQELHLGTGVTVLARLAATASEPASPFGAAVGEYRARLSAGRYLASKWRGDVLLLDYPYWFYDEPVEGTWRLVRRLLQSANENRGCLSLDDLSAAARLLTAEQMRGLDWRLPALSVAADLRDVLAVACPSRLAANQILSAQGRPLTPEITAAVRRHLILGPALDWGAVRALRVIEKDVTDPPPGGRAGREMTVGYLGADGKWVPVMGLLQEPLAPPPGLAR